MPILQISVDADSGGDDFCEITIYRGRAYVSSEIAKSGNDFYECVFKSQIVFVDLGG